MIEKEAIFSDGTEQFCSPMEADPGETVMIRFRLAADNADTIWLHYGENTQQMEFAEAEEDFAYFQSRIQMPEVPLFYYFEVCQGEERCFYTREGIVESVQVQQAFCLFPGFHTPEWAKGAVMYQIFPDRFRNGDPKNDVQTNEYAYLGKPVCHIDDWDELPQNGMDVGNFYGGDLQGVIDKLDYLQDLGIEVLYFNPLFLSPSNHKYDTQDYDAIDPHFGVLSVDAGKGLAKGDTDNTHASRYLSRVTTQENLEASNALFRTLVEEAHARGIRVLLDGVFNHCGAFHKWMDRERIYEGRPGFSKGAYLSEDSPYHDFFLFSEQGTWPCNEDYVGWWDHRTLPKLHYEGSHRLQEEILRIARKWISAPYHADGWRLDVAADLGQSTAFNHTFWKRFRKEVKKANPEALILAEHYGDPSAWLSGDEWDSVMNYDAFMEPVSWFLTGMEKHSDAFCPERYGDAAAFFQVMKERMLALPMPALLTAMNELDNHDHSRFLTRTNHHVGRVEKLGTVAAEENVEVAVLREAIVLQMTWPGAPTLYYGDEAGLCGFTDPDSRRPFPWGKEDRSLQAFCKAAIALHRQHQTLRTGSLLPLLAEPQILSYARFDRSEQILVVINNRKESAEIDIPVWRIGTSRKREQVAWHLIFESRGESFEETVRIAQYGWLHLVLAPQSAGVYQRESL